MTDPQHNGAEPSIDTPLLDPYRWKSAMDWFSQLPPLLNGKGAEDKVARRVLAALINDPHSSRSQLARAAETSERSVPAALRRLQSAELIEHVGVGAYGVSRWKVNAGHVPPTDARQARRRQLNRARTAAYRTRKATGAAAPVDTSAACLYVATFTGAVKVGVSATPATRLEAHQKVATARGWTLCHQFVTAPFEGARVAERELIATARAIGRQLWGEWFSVVDATPLRLVAADLAGALA